MADSTEEASQAEARALAASLKLPLANDEDHGGVFDLLLVVTPQRLELREPGRPRERPISVDLVNGSTGYRRDSGRSRRQPIARAVGLHLGLTDVLDATAGLGRDSFLLACLGCTVVAVERNGVLAALLRDGLNRAAAERIPALTAIISRISLVAGDARQVLAGLSVADRPDVVYLDPMHPPRLKSALTKKEMRLCRRLVGADEDAEELLGLALRAARRRVVVKRPPTGRPLSPGAATRIAGRTVRYDVYLPRG